MGSRHFAKKYRMADASGTVPWLCGLGHIGLSVRPSMKSSTFFRAASSSMTAGQ